MRSWPTWLALAAWIVGLLGQLTLDDPRRRFLEYADFAVLSSLGWWVLGFAGARDRLPRAVLALTLGMALIFRGWALFLAPAFSEDLHRYVYEGRVALERGPGFPFVHAPAEAPSLGIPPALLDESWLRVNHASIPTIYPPFAQATFILAAAIAPAFGQSELFVLKVLLVAAELAGLFLLYAGLRRRGAGHGAIAFGLACPISILEIAREGHADSLAFLGLALFCFAFGTQRSRWGYFGLAVAALAKLTGLIVLPAALRSTRRGLLATVPVFALLCLPVAFAGGAAFSGLFEYTTRWRANDGVFSLLLAVAEWVLGGDYVMFEAHAVTRHMVARAASLAVFALAAVFVLWRPSPMEEAPERAGTLLLLLLLLAPTLHPWYSIWLVPFLVYGGRDRLALAALVALAWLGHHSAWLDLGPGWTDLPSVRLLMHLPVWACFILPRLRARGSGDMLRPPSGGESWGSSKR